MEQFHFTNATQNDCALLQLTSAICAFLCCSLTSLTNDCMTWTTLFQSLTQTRNSSCISVAQQRLYRSDFSHLSRPPLYHHHRFCCWPLLLCKWLHSFIYMARPNLQPLLHPSIHCRASRASNNNHRLLTHPKFLVFCCVNCSFWWSLLQ